MDGEGQFGLPGTVLQVTVLLQVAGAVRTPEAGERKRTKKTDTAPATGGQANRYQRKSRAPY